MIFIYEVCVLYIVVFIVDWLEDMTLFELLMGLTSLRFWEIQDDHQDGHQDEVHSENDLHV